jgi:hypothetical protein
MTSTELPGLVESLRAWPAVEAGDALSAGFVSGKMTEAELNTRAADTLESLAAENERLTEENADLRNRLSRIVAC